MRGSGDQEIRLVLPKAYCTLLYKNALKTKKKISTTFLLLLLNIFITNTLYKSKTKFLNNTECIEYLIMSIISTTLNIYTIKNIKICIFVKLKRLAFPLNSHNTTFTNTLKGSIHGSSRREFFK